MSDTIDENSYVLTKPVKKMLLIHRLYLDTNSTVY